MTLTASASAAGKLIDDGADLPCLPLPYRRGTFSHHLVLPSRNIGISAVSRHDPLPVSSLKTTEVDEGFGQPRGEMDRTGSGHAVVSDPGFRPVQSEYISVRPRPKSAVRCLQSVSANHRH